MEILMVYSTYPDEDSAMQMVNLLIAEKFIACGNAMSIQSCYVWQGESLKEGEYLAIMKTSVEMKEKVQQFIKANHSYELPCILSWKVDANEDYGLWVKNSLK